MRVILAFFLSFLATFMPAAMAGPPLTWGNGRVQLLQDGAVTSAGNNVDAPNYIRNGDFARGDTGGWATYADAAGTTPVDGTGGSPNETFAATASSPLSGNWSGILTKDAANRQGQGVSYDFSIDNIDKGNVVCFSMSSELSSAGAPADFAFYVYDITNANLITPSVTAIPSGTARTFSSCFVSTSSASYRAIVHTATTSTSAMTLKVDNVKISRLPVSYGSAITDIQTVSSPTLVTDTGATVTLNATAREALDIKWKQVGDTMKLWAGFRNGTGGSASAASGTYIEIPLPTGYTVETTKLISTLSGYRVNGFGQISAQNANGGVYYNPTTNRLVIMNAAGATPDFVTLASITSGVRFSLEAEIPILNWSSNIQIANRALEEYAYNTNTADSNDTTSFGNGPSGVSFGSYSTATRTKRVRFQFPIQQTDFIAAEVLDFSTNRWILLDNSRFKALSATTGMTIQVVNATDVDVFFGSAGYAATPTGAANAWSVIAGGTDYKWRIKKISGGSVAGYPIDAANIIRDYRSTGSISGTTTLTNLNTTVLYVSSAAPRTITLPPASAELIGYAVTFKDDTGSAATNNITIAAAGSDTIDGAATNVMASNWAVRTYRVRSATSWRVE